MPGLAQSLYTRIQGRVPGYRFGGVFILLLLTYVYLASAPSTGRWVPVVGMVLMGTTLLAAILAARSGKVAFYITLVVLLCGFATVILTILGDYSSEEGIAYGITALLVLAAPVAIVRGVIQRGIIDGRTILAALSIYVLAGMLWSFVELTIQAASSHPFFAQTGKGTPSDFLYFSFVTLTTVGYGDLTAVGGFERALAVLEAMFGQIYLVTVVAVLITNMKATRKIIEPKAPVDAQTSFDAE
jgi:hypothetical protein